MVQDGNWVANSGNFSNLNSSHFIINIIFILIALNNSIDLIQLISSTSKHTKLYLWVLFPTPIWTILYCISWIMGSDDLFKIREFPIRPVLEGCDYIANVVSFVLYSELQNLYDSQVELPHTLVTFIITNIAGHLPFFITSVTVIICGTSLSTFSFIFGTLTKLRGMLLVIQETFLSKLYVRSSNRFYDTEIVWVSTKYLGILHLLGFNLIAILLSSYLAHFEWAGSHSFETAYKCFIYSLKWRVELSIFKVLVELNQAAIHYNIS